MTGWKEWIAERFFEHELDEAYAMGVGEGMRCATQTISFRVSIRDKELTKTQTIGLNKALDVINDFKRELR